MVNWLSVRLLLVLSHIHGLSSKSIDFVLAFPQADLEVPMHMELPSGVKDSSNSHLVLRLKVNLYGMK